ncbi:VanZ family protein [Cupriavidus sp. AU9028]|uniref:VanZ family protein n=1 Tax=Cupriavidus sp. AU9028 TaxID=2871157 RepID=UPI001C9814D8|nr:VanZ family protein [Cupriavidus sp. AU9028]MBY4896369.1 VanZ family protein [Cupriavidus sp. AU9028]
MLTVPRLTSPHWRLAFWLCLACVLVLSLLPPSAPVTGTGWDKGNHLLAFSTLALLGWRAYPGRTGAVVAGLLVFGALIECLQWMTPYRDADWIDLFADSVGIALGAVLQGMAELLRGGRRQRSG